MDDLIIRGRKLLPHWAQHLREHAHEVARWREALGDTLPDSASTDVERAERAMQEAVAALEAAGGALKRDVEGPHDG